MAKKKAFKAIVLTCLALTSPVGHVAWAGLSSELQTVESAPERKIRELREAEITEVRKALGLRSAANRKADLYFRLAELYLEAYRASFLLEGRALEKRVQAGEKGAKLDRSTSKPFLRAGIEASEEIVDLGIPFDRMEQVYYFLGFNHAQMGDVSKAERYFQLLVSRFPQSPYAPEAYRELGDSAFERRQYPEARKYYEKALALKQTDSAPRIWYRLAWCQYRMKDFARAISSMKQSISISNEKGEKFVSLRDEALRDLALFMAEGGDTAGALKYFSEQSKDSKELPKTLERLARQLDRQGEQQGAQGVFEAALKAGPDADTEARIRTRLVEMELKRNRVAAAVAKLKGLRLPDDPKEETRVGYLNLRASVRKQAIIAHEGWRKYHDRERLPAAELLYAAYLNEFLAVEDSKQESAEIKMYLADVKTELGKAAEAAELYQQIMESKESRYAKDAGVLLVGSLAEAIKKKGTATGSKTAPSELELKLVDASDRLVKAAPQSSEALQAQLRSAQILAGYANTAVEGEGRARELARQSSGHAAVVAGRLWLQLVADRVQDPKKVEPAAYQDQSGALSAVVNELDQNKALREFDRREGGKLAAELAAQRERLRLGSLVLAEKTGENGTAAKAYEEYAASSKDLPDAEKAYQNALVLYSRANDAVGMKRVVAAWSKRATQGPKPSNKLKEALKSQGTAQLIEGHFELSVALLEEAGRIYKDDSLKETALRIAVAAQLKKAPATKSAPLPGEAQFKAALATEKKLPPAPIDPAHLEKTVEKRVAQFKKISTVYQSLPAGPFALMGAVKQAEWVNRFVAEVDALGKPEISKALSEPLKKQSRELLGKSYQQAIKAQWLHPVVPELHDAWVFAGGSGVSAQGPAGKWRLAGVPAEGGDAPGGREGALVAVREKLRKNVGDAAAWLDYGNLLWGSGYPHLAELCYDRALALNSKLSGALNNQAVVALSVSGAVGQMDVAMKANENFKRAQAMDAKSKIHPAAFNRAQLLNYYRHFQAAAEIWRDLSQAQGAQTVLTEIQKGAAVSAQGMGNGTEAQAQVLNDAYHQAARQARQGGSGHAACLESLERVDGASLSPFEKQAVDRLKAYCSEGKKGSG